MRSDRHAVVRERSAIDGALLSEQPLPAEEHVRELATPLPASKEMIERLTTSRLAFCRRLPYAVSYDGRRCQVWNTQTWMPMLRSDGTPVGLACEGVRMLADDRLLVRHLRPATESIYTLPNLDLDELPTEGDADAGASTSLLRTTMEAQDGGLERHRIWDADNDSPVAPPELSTESRQFRWLVPAPVGNTHLVWDTENCPWLWTPWRWSYLLRMPEFYATIVFALLLIVSIMKGRKATGDEERHARPAQEPWTAS
jgi:hypothetical protein